MILPLTFSKKYTKPKNNHPIRQKYDIMPIILSCQRNDLRPKKSTMPKMCYERSKTSEGSNQPSLDWNVFFPQFYSEVILLSELHEF
jgi:hypothetical protein